MSSMPEAALLREVSRVQNDKTIQSIRDLIDSIPIKKDGARHWDKVDRSATEFRNELVEALKKMRVDEA